MNGPINRRNFLAYLGVGLVLSRCKKESQPLKQVSKVPVADTPPAPPPPEIPLGQYGITSMGDKLYPELDVSKSVFCYTDKSSYFPGDSVSIYMTAPTNPSRTINLLDANMNVVASVQAPTFVQKIKGSTPWVDGLGFEKTATIDLPANLKSGVYKIEGRVNTPVIVKSKDEYDITIIYPSNTDAAYCFAGGKSLYGPDLDNRSTVVSFARYPWGAGDYTSPFFEWINKQSYKLNCIADVDADDEIHFKNSKIVILVGHSEYWTRKARENVDKFVATGKNLLVLSGNTMWWQVRYNNDKNLMICYRGDKNDPLHSTPYETDLWYKDKLNYPITSSIGADFINGGYANKLPNHWDYYKITSENSPLFEGTGLKNGEKLILPTYEADGAPLVKNILPGSTELPVIDNSKLNFYKTELLGYNFTIDGVVPGVATFIVFQKTVNSGTVVNVASEEWCSSSGIGGKDAAKIKTITKNMIDKSLEGRSLFSA